MFYKENEFEVDHNRLLSTERILKVNTNQTCWLKLNAEIYLYARR